MKTNPLKLVAANIADSWVGQAWEGKAVKGRHTHGGAHITADAVLNS